MTSSKTYQEQTTEEMLNTYWNEIFPLALECGMTPTQFWDEEPRLFHSYLVKHQLMLSQINYESWLIGLYVNIAFQVGLSGFSKGSNAKYCEKPIEAFNGYKPKEKIGEYRETVNYWSKFKTNKERRKHAK